MSAFPEPVMGRVALPARPAKGACPGGRLGKASLPARFMVTRRASRCLLSLGLAALLGSSACSKKEPAHNQLSELEKAFPTQEQNVYVAAALSAVRSNDFVGAVMMLQSIQRTSGVSVQQRMAVQKAMLAIVADLTARADRGDPQAKADLAAIERSRSQ